MADWIKDAGESTGRELRVGHLTLRVGVCQGRDAGRSWHGWRWLIMARSRTAFLGFVDESSDQISDLIPTMEEAQAACIAAARRLLADVTNQLPEVTT